MSTAACIAHSLPLPSLLLFEKYRVPAKCWAAARRRAQHLASERETLVPGKGLDRSEGRREAGPDLLTLVILVSAPFGQSVWVLDGDRKWSKDERGGCDKVRYGEGAHCSAGGRVR